LGRGLVVGLSIFIERCLINSLTSMKNLFFFFFPAQLPSALSNCAPSPPSHALFTLLPRHLHDNTTGRRKFPSFPPKLRCLLLFIKYHGSSMGNSWVSLVLLPSHAFKETLCFACYTGTLSPRPQKKGNGIKRSIYLWSNSILSIQLLSPSWSLGSADTPLMIGIILS
jgi:hypothetical protein